LRIVNVSSRKTTTFENIQLVMRKQLSEESIHDSQDSEIYETRKREGFVVCGDG
jgi:hypothetical protein